MAARTGRRGVTGVSGEIGGLAPGSGAVIGSSVNRRGYHRYMKTTYLFIAILACSVLGAMVKDRGVKTALFVTTGVLSLYGLFRLIG